MLLKSGDLATVDGPVGNFVATIRRTQGGVAVGSTETGVRRLRGVPRVGYSTAFQIFAGMTDEFS